MSLSQSHLPIGSYSGLPSTMQEHYRHLDQGPGFQPEEIDEGIDLLKIFWHMVHYRWLITAFLITGIILGIFITLVQTPLYSSTALIEIQTPGAKVFQELDTIASSTDARIYETSREKMRSRDLAQRVVYELDLANKADFLAPTPTFSLTNMFRKITNSTTQQQLDDISLEERTTMAVNLIRIDLSIKLKKKTSILEVAFSHPLPQYAEAVANQVVRSYIDQNVDQRGETSNLARQFIEEQVQETKKKLQVSEKSLVDYAQREGITITGNDYSLISDNIADINKALAEAIQERLGAERMVQQITNGNAAALPEVFKSESIQTTKQKIAELRATYQQNLQTLKPGYPEMVRLQAQINELAKQVQFEVNAIATSTRIKFDQSHEKVESLRRELADLERRQSEFQQKNIQYTILKREVDSNRTQYDSLIKKLNEVGVGSELRSSNASIVDLAIIPTKAYFPKLSINLILSFIFSGCLAGGVVFILELLNNTFATPDQLERDLKLNVLGIIPHTTEEQIMDELDNPKSSISEAYRTLRTSLQFAGTDSNACILTVTSSEPTEGKSSTCLKLARDFSTLGKKVLLIDCDMRKPKLHRFLETHNAIGLSNLLTNVVKSGNINEIFRSTSTPNLTFISSGTIPPNPSDILMSHKMAMMLQVCKKRYDLVILDCPPVIGLSDAPILAHQADLTLLVVAAKQASRKSTTNTMKRLKGAGANVVGAVFTKFQASKHNYDYAYRYMSYNYYSYSEENEPIANLVDHAERIKNKKGKRNTTTTPIFAFINRFTRHFS